MYSMKDDNRPWVLVKGVGIWKGDGMTHDNTQASGCDGCTPGTENPVIWVHDGFLCLQCLDRLRRQLVEGTEYCKRLVALDQPPKETR